MTWATDLWPGLAIIVHQDTDFATSFIHEGPDPHQRPSHVLACQTGSLARQVLCDQDKQMISALGKEFELDFVSLSFTREAEDVESARHYLQSIGLGSTKVHLL